MNKVVYWKNREAGKRGQGEFPITVMPDLGYIHPNFYPHNRRQRHIVQPSDPQLTKTHTNRIKKLTRGKVLRIEEIRHLRSLARKGLL